MSEEDFQAWLKTLPKTVRELARKYPPGVYRMKEGAPYGVSCGGTIVQFYSYHREGTISVVVPAENKLPEAIEFETMRGREYGKTASEIRAIHEANILVEVDPIWLEQE